MKIIRNKNKSKLNTRFALKMDNGIFCEGPKQINKISNYFNLRTIKGQNKVNSITNEKNKPEARSYKAQTCIPEVTIVKSIDIGVLNSHTSSQAKTEEERSQHNVTLKNSE